MMSEVSPFLWSFDHQLEKRESSGCGAKGSKPNTWKIAVQTCLAKTQATRVCCIVSSAWPQRTNWRMWKSSFCKVVRFPNPLPRCKFDGPCEKCHIAWFAKVRAWSCKSPLVLIGSVLLKIKIVNHVPELQVFQQTSIVKAPLVSATQLLFCKACATVRCFKALLGMILIRLGAMLCNTWDLHW